MTRQRVPRVTVAAVLLAVDLAAVAPYVYRGPVRRRYR